MSEIGFTVTTRHKGAQGSNPALGALVGGSRPTCQYVGPPPHHCHPRNAIAPKECLNPLVDTPKMLNKDRFRWLQKLQKKTSNK